MGGEWSEAWRGCCLGAEGLETSLLVWGLEKSGVLEFLSWSLATSGL